MVSKDGLVRKPTLLQEFNYLGFKWGARLGAIFTVGISLFLDPSSVVESLFLGLILGAIVGAPVGMVLGVINGSVLWFVTIRFLRSDISDRWYRLVTLITATIATLICGILTTYAFESSIDARAEEVVGLVVGLAMFSTIVATVGAAIASQIVAPLYLELWRQAEAHQEDDEYFYPD